MKGKTEPESVYTVLGGADVAGGEQFGQLHHDVNEMLAQFRQRDFAGAANTIARCRKISNGFGLDYLFDLYDERIRTFETDPPPADWNGVFVLDSK